MAGIVAGGTTSQQAALQYSVVSGQLEYSCAVLRTRSVSIELADCWLTGVSILRRKKSEFIYSDRYVFLWRSCFRRR